MMLGKVVDEDTLFPENVELALANAIEDPGESHVGGLGLSLFGRVHGDASTVREIAKNMFLLFYFNK